MAEEETVLEDYWVFKNEKGLPVAVLDSEPQEGIVEHAHYALKNKRTSIDMFQCLKKHWAFDDNPEEILPAYIHGLAPLDDPWEQIGTIERIDKQDYELCIAFGLCKDG